MKMNKMKQNDIMKAVDKLRFHYVTITDLFGRKERAKKNPQRITSGDLGCNLSDIIIRNNRTEEFYSPPYISEF